MAQPKIKDNAVANDITSGNVDGFVVGTGADEILQLNASAQIPAVDGSLITDLLFVQDASDNVFGGKGLGSLVTTANDNVIIGDCSDAPNQLSTGDFNVLIGQRAGNYITTGTRNVAVGTQALIGDFTNKLTGSYNVAIGNQALFNLEGVGGNNTAVGHAAGQSIVTGVGNVLLGELAGPTTDQSNQLFINNAQSDTPLIHGNFSTGDVTINGDLSVTGTITGAGTVITMLDTPIQLYNGVTPPTAATALTHANLTGKSAGIFRCKAIAVVSGAAATNTQCEVIGQVGSSSGLTSAHRVASANAYADAAVTANVWDYDTTEITVNLDGSSQVWYNVLKSVPANTTVWFEIWLTGWHD